VAEKVCALVHAASELDAAVEGASREANKSFGDGTLLMEKYFSSGPAYRVSDIRLIRTVTTRTFLSASVLYKEGIKKLLKKVLRHH